MMILSRTLRISFFCFGVTTFLSTPSFSIGKISDVNTPVRVVGRGIASDVVFRPRATPKPKPKPTATPRPTATPTPTPTPAATAAYYVSPTGNNSNAGTMNAPWLTIQNATTKAPANSTIYIRGGTYTLGSKIKITKAGQKYVGYQNEVVKIVAPSNNSSTFDVAIWIDVTADRTTLENLDIAGGYYYAVKLESHWDYDFSIPAANRDAAKNVTLNKLKIHDTGRDGIKVTPGCNFTTITNSEIYKTGVRDNSNSEGIDVVNGSDLVIRGNDIHDIPTTGLYTKGGSTRVLIENNRIRRVGNGGIMVGFYTDYEWFDQVGNPQLYECVDCTVRNNRIEDTGYAGIGLYSSKNAKILNNTLLNTAKNGQAAILFDTTDIWTDTANYKAPNINPTIANNIVSWTSGSGKSAILFRQGERWTGGDNYVASPSLTGSATIRNTLYYVGSSGSFVFKDSRSSAPGCKSNCNLSTWMGLGWDAQSLSANPALTADLKIGSTSGAIDRGMTRAEVAFDFEGQSRPRGAAYDIGADEY